MSIQTIRRVVQVMALLVMLLIPILESYKRILVSLDPQYIGSLWQYYSDFSAYLPDYLKGGYLSWLVVAFDAVLGNLFSDLDLLRQLLADFGGSYWSVTIAGFTFLDPLSFLQVLAAPGALSWSLGLAILVPVLLAVLMGRVFCSWICPVNTILELNHKIVKKLGLRRLQIKLFSNPNWRYWLLVIGILAPLLGITVFPYILPYAVLGRVLYYLTAGKVLYIGVAFLALLIVLDGLIQRGFWCNYLCPSGALLALLGSLKLVKPKRQADQCREGCSACSKVCAWEANPKTDDLWNCSNCLACSRKCPGKALSWH